ncbi:hypothetical protein F5B17DRAFT_425685 [Nemania serpens]|nr:hypothetical protein F5B17DRAFT_425685 [Nemania serpens]
MLGRAVVPGNVIRQDAMAIRATALGIIEKAWRDNILVSIQRSTGRKRVGGSIHQRPKKRQKTDNPDQVECLTV